MSLIDTNVLSEVRRPLGSQRVKELFRALGDTPRISAIVLGEIRFGVQLTSDARKRAEIGAWYKALVSRFSDRILPVNAAVAECWGDLAAAARQGGRALDAPDGLIAATALVHDLTLWTRNTKDFEGLGIAVFNPWEDRP